MEETAIIERLVLFGLTRQEAMVYLCLFRNGELTGYEVAKQTGISRSNVYSALAGLVGNGAAYLIEGVANKYLAVSIEELCDNRIRKMTAEKKYLVEHMPMKAEVSDGYITIEGTEHIYNKIHQMLLGAEQRIYLSAPCSIVDMLQEELDTLTARHIKVVLITDKKPKQQGILFYIGENKTEKQIRLIIDSKYVLTGEMQGKGTDTCLYSAQKNFVNVFKEALRNEIKLITLTGQEKALT